MNSGTRTLGAARQAERFRSAYGAFAPPAPGRAGELARRRGQAVHALLGRRSYGRVWAPDCADEELAALLARLAAHLRVTSGRPDVLARIGQRCAHMANVVVDSGASAPAAVQSAFDLIVISHLDSLRHAADIVRAAATLARALAPRGELIAVHPRGYAGAPTAEGGRGSRILHVDAVHHLLLEHLPLEWRAGHRDGEFRLDAWVR